MRLAKIAASLLLLTLLSASGLYAYFSRDAGPTHPSLVAATLPPLIPVRDFYADTDAEWDYQPSFDGEMIAWYAVDWASTVIRVQRMGDTKPFVTLSGAEFDGFHWHPYKNELIVFAGGRRWQIDPRRPNRGHWTDVSPRGFRNWRIISTPAGPADLLVVASNDRGGELYDLYTVRQDGTGKQLLESNDGAIVDWGLDGNNVPVVRVSSLEDYSTIISYRPTPRDPWRTLIRAGARDLFTVLGAPEAGQPLFALSDLERDRVALVAIDLQTGRESVVAEDPGGDVQYAFTFGAHGAAPDFAEFEDGYPRLRALSRRGEAFLAHLLDAMNPVSLSILGESTDGRFITVSRSRREQSFEYFFLDLATDSMIKIGEHSFRKHREALSETRPVSFRARDGLEIPAFLTLPRGIQPKKLPAIVVIHGGPARQETWGYNHEFQFLANRGYAVLSVNFRGSTGYGRAFRTAGYGQVGMAMQDDIVDAANWLVSEGIADRDNIVAMGASYGGYSAALAMTRDPGVFKAAIVEAAVTDLASDAQNLPTGWSPYFDEFTRYYGDPTSLADLEQMRQRSPLTHAADVKGPILILAGKQDSNVPVENSEKFERALRAAGKEVTAVYFENEGHGYSRWQSDVRRARVIEDFLAAELGGRSGSFDYVELAAKILE